MLDPDPRVRLRLAIQDVLDDRFPDTRGRVVYLAAEEVLAVLGASERREDLAAWVDSLADPTTIKELLP